MSRLGLWAFPSADCFFPGKSVCGSSEQITHSRSDGSQQYIVQLCHGAGQRKGRTPQYSTVMLSRGYKLLAAELPSQLNLLSCRARPIEKTQLRCRDANCRLRPESERDAAVQAEKEGQDPDRELQPDDLDALGVDAQNEETLEGEEEAAREEEIIACPAEEKPCLVDLWPFGFSVARYRRQYEALGIV